MISDSCRSASRFAGVAAALIAAALPSQGGTAVKSAQAGTHAAQAASGIAVALAGQHALPLQPMHARTDSRFSADCFHHWSP